MYFVNISDFLDTSSIRVEEYCDINYSNRQNCMDISKFCKIDENFAQIPNYVDLLKETMQNQIASLNTENNIFEKDWNGYRSEPIRKESIDMMLKYLENFDVEMTVPEIMLEPYGSIALYWGTEKGSFVLAFNDKKKQIEYSIVNKDTSYTGFGTLEKIDDVKELIKKIC